MAAAKRRGQPAGILDRRGRVRSDAARRGRRRRPIYQVCGAAPKLAAISSIELSTEPECRRRGVPAAHLSSSRGVGQGSSGQLPRPSSPGARARPASRLAPRMRQPGRDAHDPVGDRPVRLSELGVRRCGKGGRVEPVLARDHHGGDHVERGAHHLGLEVQASRPTPRASARACWRRRPPWRGGRPSARSGRNAGAAVRRCAFQGAPSVVSSPAPSSGASERTIASSRASPVRLLRQQDPDALGIDHEGDGWPSSRPSTIGCSCTSAGQASMRFRNAVAAWRRSASGPRPSPRLPQPSSRARTGELTPATPIMPVLPTGRYDRQTVPHNPASTRHLTRIRHCRPSTGPGPGPCAARPPSTGARWTPGTSLQ